MYALFDAALSGLSAVINDTGDGIDILGSVAGTFTDLEGIETPLAGTFSAPLDLGASGAGETCDILNLVLGPLELDILGLVVQIPEPVILNIFAEQGAGNLLGNLLCAVTALLDNAGNPLGGITNLLNQIFGLLG